MNENTEFYQEEDDYLHHYVGEVLPHGGVFIGYTEQHSSLASTILELKAEFFLHLTLRSRLSLDRFTLPPLGPLDLTPCEGFLITLFPRDFKFVCSPFRLFCPFYHGGLYFLDTFEDSPLCRSYTVFRSYEFSMQSYADPSTDRAALEFVRRRFAKLQGAT